MPKYVTQFNCIDCGQTFVGRFSAQKQLCDVCKKARITKRSKQWRKDNAKSRKRYWTKYQQQWKSTNVFDGNSFTNTKGLSYCGIPDYGIIPSAKVIPKDINRWLDQKFILESIPGRCGLSHTSPLKKPTIKAHLKHYSDESKYPLTEDLRFRLDNALRKQFDEKEEKVEIKFTPIRLCTVCNQLHTSEDEVCVNCQVKCLICNSKKAELFCKFCRPYVSRLKQSTADFVFSTIAGWNDENPADPIPFDDLEFITGLSRRQLMLSVARLHRDDLIEVHKRNLVVFTESGFVKANPQPIIKEDKRRRPRRSFSQKVKVSTIKSFTDTESVVSDKADLNATPKMHFDYISRDTAIALEIENDLINSITDICERHNVSLKIAQSILNRLRRDGKIPRDWKG